jgi:hypothetical protein
MDRPIDVPVDEPLSPVNIAIVKKLLADQGLYVVTAAEKAVLDAAARARDDRRLDHSFAHWAQAVWDAEQARRETKP